MSAFLHHIMLIPRCQPPFPLVYLCDVEKGASSANWSQVLIEGGIAVVSNLRLKNYTQLQI